MSSAEVSLAGDRIVSGSIEIPAYGLWAADVVLADDTTLPASAPLVLGDLTLQSYAYRTFAYAGSRRSRLVGGYGGWMQTVQPQEWANPPGLTLSLVLNDLAALIGEKVNVGADQVFGSFLFTRLGAAKRVLDRLVGRTWWIDPSGTVQVGVARSSAVISSAFTLNEFDGATGRAVISTENPSDWMPGRTWTAPTVTVPQTVSSVRHSVVDGALRTEALSVGPESADRMIAPLRELVEDLAPDAVYYGTWEYAVQDTDGTFVSCKPTASAVLAAPFPLPQHVTGVVMRPGLPGCKVKPGIGSYVYVAFANGDPSRPLITTYDSNAAQSVGFDCGTGTAEHLMTSEAVLGLLGTMLTALAPNFTSAPVPDTVLATAVAAAATQNIGTSLSTSYAALLAALALKTGDTGGTVPNLGCKNIRGG